VLHLLLPTFSPVNIQIINRQNHIIKPQRERSQKNLKMSSNFHMAIDSDNKANSPTS